MGKINFKKFILLKTCFSKLIKECNDHCRYSLNTIHFNNSKLLVIPRHISLATCFSNCIFFIFWSSNWTMQDIHSVSFGCLKSKELPPFSFLSSKLLCYFVIRYLGILQNLVLKRLLYDFMSAQHFSHVCVNLRYILMIKCCSERLYEIFHLRKYENGD